MTWSLSFAKNPLVDIAAPYWRSMMESEMPLRTHRDLHVAPAGTQSSVAGYLDAWPNELSATCFRVFVQRIFK